MWGGRAEQQRRAECRAWEAVGAVAGTAERWMGKEHGWLCTCAPVVRGRVKAIS